MASSKTAAGKKRITINDIAQMAGTSKTTVSFYLNGKTDRMSEETQKRIRLAIDETGYQPSPLARRLVNTTYEAMRAGIMAVKPGATLGDIGHAIQTVAHREHFSIVREYCGHGIGQIYHDDPQVLHYGKPGTGVPLTTGMLFTIEPMINAGRREIRQLSDGWTVVTRDHSLSAQWEHAVCVTETGYEVLTLSPGMPQPPAFITEPLVIPAV